MRKFLSISAAALVLLFAASAAHANQRPHEGKILRIETVEKSADVAGQTVANVQHSRVIQGEKGDQWTLYWDDTTRFKHELAPSELREGDRVHFDFVEKDGKMWLTELRRTKKAHD